MVSGSGSGLSSWAQPLGSKTARVIRQAANAERLFIIVLFWG